MTALDKGYQQLIADQMCHWAQMAKEAIAEAAYEYGRPSSIFKPKIYIDGDQWCALYGEDLQCGVAGFGKSPADAMWDFDRNWNTPLSLGEQK